MKTSFSAGRRLVAPLSIASLVTAFAFLMGPAILCCNSAEDVERRQKIESLYGDYKKRSFPAVIDVEPRLAMDLAGRQEVVFVDVRTPEEQGVSMIPGAVTKEEFLSHLEQYKDKIIIGYCTISYRSGKLARELRDTKGITLYNLRGGLLGWVHDGGKVVDRRGETKHIHVYGRKWNLAPSSFEATW